jgi:hypothetical protein
MITRDVSCIHKHWSCPYDEIGRESLIIRLGWNQMITFEDLSIFEKHLQPCSDGAKQRPASLFSSRPRYHRLIHVISQTSSHTPWSRFRRPPSDSYWSRGRQMFGAASPHLARKHSDLVRGPTAETEGRTTAVKKKQVD